MDRIVLDMHVDYDSLKGTCKRVAIDLNNPRSYAFIELYYWSIASLGALLWIFFENIDIMEIGMEAVYVLSLIHI